MAMQTIQIIKLLVPDSLWALAKNKWLKLKSRKLLSDLSVGAGGNAPNCPTVSYLVFRGLANRMRAHIIAQDFAIRTKRTLVVRWGKTSECGANFTDLFVWDGPSSTSIRDVCLVGYDHVTDVSTDKLTSDLSNETVVFDNPWQFISRHAFEARLGANINAARTFLIPRPDILNEVNAFACTWPASMLGVHIRRGDFVNVAQGISLTRYITAIHESLKTMPSNTEIFIATDAQPEEIGPLTADFLGRIRLRPNMQRDSEAGVKSALVDMLLLSRTNFLVLTPLSSFGEMAAFLGNVPFKSA
jgi:hypothetical protein